MELQDHERRVLAEIEQHLIDEDPDLDVELTNLTADLQSIRAVRSRRSRPIVVIATVAAFLIAVTTILVGVAISSLVLIVLGAVLTASIPLGMAWRAWRDRSQ